MKKSREKIRYLVLLALFIAIMLVLQFSGIGLIELGIIKITFLCTVIAIGTLMMDLKFGMILAILFASISFYGTWRQPSALIAPIYSNSIGATFLLSFLPRLPIPLVIVGVRRFVEMLGSRINQKRKNARDTEAVDAKEPRGEKTSGKRRLGLQTVAMAASAASGSLTNSILYLGGILLLYQVFGIKDGAILKTVGAIGLTASLPEAAAAAIVTPPVVLALQKIKR